MGRFIFSVALVAVLWNVGIQKDQDPHLFAVPIG